MQNIVIPNQRKLDEKIQAIREAGPDSLHILSDFDRTLIKAYVNGKKIWSLLAIMRDNDCLSPDYSRQAKKLAAHYYPIEKDANVPLAERKRLMLEWWSKHFELLIASGLSQNDIKQAISSSQIELRDGTETFFESLDTHNIPLVIMSASGIGDDAISQFLASKNLLTKNVHLISNRIRWDSQGKAIGVHQPIIHSLNKDETIIQNFPVYKEVKNRKNVILLGDFIDDIGMVQGFEYTNLISVGFLNEDTSKHLPEYRKYFDVIITDDGPMEYINKLLADVLQ
ncbi:MAG: hypothetical protein V1668_03445 [Patescibacteria group bacterium]